MDISGKLVEILAEQSGQGKNGTWVKTSFILETQEQYPRKVCIDAWGDKVDDVRALKIDDTVKVDFDVESREYNGRWYTNIKAWKIAKQSGDASGNGKNPPLPTIEDSESMSSEPTDDLPF
ncbi:MAG: hypothetical protein AUJ98_03340 [Bacteroidetes bacterium CG2_30_33_31]|nr:MAG: hypothetical protein AUJ98_03340 [Bacteroidetes bacterium CG2_30_33_31]